MEPDKKPMSTPYDYEIRVSLSTVTNVKEDGETSKNKRLFVTFGSGVLEAAGLTPGISRVKFVCTPLECLPPDLVYCGFIETFEPAQFGSYLLSKGFESKRYTKKYAKLTMAQKDHYPVIQEGKQLVLQKRYLSITEGAIAFTLPAKYFPRRISKMEDNSKMTNANRLENYTPSGQTLAIENALEKLKAAVQPFDMKVQRNEDGSVNVVCSADNAILVHAAMIAATGTVYTELSEKLVRQTASASFPTETLEAEVQAVNMVTRALLEIGPKDGIEGMLAAQMVAVHNQAMECLKMAIRPGLRAGVAANYRNQAAKLLRTFTAQMEALKRNRTGGKQKMTIKHIHVHQGGQAVIGVQAGDGGG